MSEDYSLDSIKETKIGTKRIYEGRIISVREDTVELPDGKRAKREVIEHSAAVCIVPVDENGNVLLVRQFRIPTDGPLLEVPAGGVEDGEVDAMQ